MYKKYRIGLLLLLLLIGCAKEENGLPNVTIRLTVPLGNPDYFELQSGVGGAAFFPNEGIAGIVISNTGSSPLYRAFDLCSTVDPEKRCVLELDDSGFNLEDPCSGAKFFLLNGLPSSKPAKRALKEYQVMQQGNVLYVMN